MFKLFFFSHHLQYNRSCRSLWQDFKCFYVCLVLFRYTYIFGQNTWVEYWPREEECVTDTYRATCLGISEMEEVHYMFGCLQK